MLLHLLGLFVTNPVLDINYQNFLTLPGKSGWDYVNSIAPRIVWIALIIGTTVFFVMLIAGAIGWITSGGDKAKIEDAKGRLTDAITGLIILFLVFLITAFVNAYLGLNIGDIDIPTPGPTPTSGPTNTPIPSATPTPTTGPSATPTPIGIYCKLNRASNKSCDDICWSSTKATCVGVGSEYLDQGTCTNGLKFVDGCNQLSTACFDRMDSDLGTCNSIQTQWTYCRCDSR